MSLNVIKQKIKQDIIKSGYPLEIFCREKIYKFDLGLEQTQYYKTQDGSYGEIDIETSVQDNWKKGKNRVILHSQLLIECKKNRNNPWVFFKEDDLIIPNFYSDLDDLFKIIMMKFIDKDNHRFNSMANTSRNYFVALVDKNAKEGKQIYEGISKLIDFLKYDRELHFNRWGRKKKNYVNVIVLPNLVIVFDGLMFMANIIKDSVQLERINHVAVTVYHSDFERRYDSFVVEIITKQYFSKFLSIFKKDHVVMVDFFKNNLKNRIRF